MPERGTACAWQLESCGITAEQEGLEQSQGLVASDGTGHSSRALSLEKCSEELASWHSGELVKHLMGKGAFLCCEKRARQARVAAGPVLDWAGCWAAKLGAVRCGDFAGNFKEFLELELLWGLQ